MPVLAVAARNLKTVAEVNTGYIKAEYCPLTGGGFSLQSHSQTQNNTIQVLGAPQPENSTLTR